MSKGRYPWWAVWLLSSFTVSIIVLSVFAYGWDILWIWLAVTVLVVIMDTLGRRVERKLRGQE